MSTQTPYATKHPHVIPAQAEIQLRCVSGAYQRARGTDLTWTGIMCTSRRALSGPGAERVLFIVPASDVTGTIRVSI